MKLRTGRHNDRIVYAQTGAEPSDSDRMVAVFFHASDAADYVELNNTAYKTISQWREFDKWLDSKDD